MNPKTLFPYRLPAVLGLAHGVSDGAAGLLLGSLATDSPAAQIALLVLIYNALAFGSQPLIGYFADSLRSPRIFASGGMTLLATSLVSRALDFGELAVLMAGLGSAAFHVGAGALTFRACGGRWDAAGLFAAPGVIGLAIGGALAVSGHYLYLPFLISLLAFVFVIQAWPIPAREASISKPTKEPIFEVHDWIMIGLLTAVALRSLLWTSFQLASAGQITALITLGVAAGVGKIIGALHEKNIELQKTLEARDLFLANMSHELRTPLNGIIGFAEFLADGRPGPVSPKQKEYLEDILHSGKHLLHVINEVLDIAKVEAGKMELSPEPFSIAKAVDDVYAALELTAQRKQLQISIQLDPDFDEVALDRDRFKQVLYNLFSNAVKFTDEGGSVEVVSTKIDHSRFRLVVADTGIGIKPEDLKRLFKQFEQISPGQRRGQGTGLGLALTRRIVELQSGTIDVESEFGKGTKFTIVLPMVLPPLDSDAHS